MRIVRFAPQAERTLADQFDYLVSQGATAPAHTMLNRVEAFLHHTLAVYPRTGRPIAEHGLWETWIPGTRLVVWYVFTDEELTALTFWHTAQDRR